MIRPVGNPIRLDAIAESCRSRLCSEPAPVAALDHRTWQDLNFDDVFASLDRTVSTLGQHALYYRLRTTPARDLDAFEALTTRLDADRPFRAQARAALARLRDPHGYDLWWLGKPDAIEIRRWFAVFPFLSGLTFMLIALAAIWTQFVPVLIAALAANVAVRYATDRHVGAIAGAFRQIAPVVATAERLRVLPDELPRLRRLKNISRWITGDPFMISGSARPFAMLSNDIVQVFYEYLNLAFLLDANGAYFGAADLRRHGASLLRVAAAAGDVDAALSVSTIRNERSDWIRPRFRASGEPAVLADVRHPLIADAVPNSIVLQTGRGVLITGSNMSGKSTFLRAVGVNVVLAQTIHTCFAGGYDAPTLAVASCMGRTDDLPGGKSYYIVEAESLLELVARSASTAPHLFLLDELFRGTNAVERIAAGQAVLRELNDSAQGSRPHFVIAATHDAELVDILRETYAPYHFSDAVGAEGLVFDHRLRPGPATTRNAIALLRLLGAPDQLIARALACAEALERQRSDAISRR
jgi:hypothetical protein